MSVNSKEYLYTTTYTVWCHWSFTSIFFLHYQYYGQLSKEGKVLYCYKNTSDFADFLKGCLGPPGVFWPYFENHWSKPFSLLCPLLNLTISLKFSLPKPLCSYHPCICILITLVGSLCLVLSTFYLSCLSSYFPNFLRVRNVSLNPYPTPSPVTSRVFLYITHTVKVFDDW